MKNIEVTLLLLKARKESCYAHFCEMRDEFRHFELKMDAEPGRVLANMMRKGFKTTKEAALTVTHIAIKRSEGGEYYSQIVSVDDGTKDIRTMAIGSALLVAYAYKAPIIINEDLLNEITLGIEALGILIAENSNLMPKNHSQHRNIQRSGTYNKLTEERKDKVGSAGKSELNAISAEDLEVSLQAAVAEEHFELAAEIKTEINRRKGSDK